MGIQIIINTDEITESDKNLLAVLAGTTASAAPTASAASAAPAKKAAPAAKKAAAKPAPEPEPEEDTADDEDLLGGEPTLADAVAKATELVGAGKGAQVKAALTAVGVARVSNLSEDQVADFLAALDA